ncbi:diphthine--ammonia ligase [Candidatus Micrarchaeota archaeon]|nr:diphthine--ammonia ligase [Candidatus Micrarchaeota archaeon]
MCGIIGFFNVKNGITVNTTIIAHRGKDEYKEVEIDKGKFAHYLHAMVGHSKQPLEGEGILTANCEVYNWRDINEQFGFNTSNDAETLLKLLDMYYTKHTDPEEFFTNIRNIIDGIYAFAYYRDDKVYVMRDAIGVRPVWYKKNDGFIFASEGKVLRYPYTKDKTEPIELHPRHCLVYDTKINKLEDYYTPWNPLKRKTSQLNDGDLFNLIMESVRKRTDNVKKVALLFSGGIDSTVLALVLKHLGKDVTGYVTGTTESRDVKRALEIGNQIGIRVVPTIINDKNFEEILSKVIYHIESCDPVKVSVAVPIYLSCQRAAHDNHRMIITGAGSDDIFAGYERHLKAMNYGHDLNRELLSSIRTLYERDLYRDDTVSMAHTIETRIPFLDTVLVNKVLNSPANDKVSYGKKTMLKKLLKYMETKGMPKVKPVRLAAQYGSGANRLIIKLMKKKGFSLRGQYLKTFKSHFNTPIGALFSGGKDSGLALWIMKNRGYPIKCLITIISENEESFMFHVPNIRNVPGLSEKAGIPLITRKTSGEKEQELCDLEKAIRTAVEEYKIQGITSGAIASVYQRNRIEEITEKIGIKNYLPLWYMDQEQELNMLIKNGFKIKIIHTSAEGLKPFENKILSTEMIKDLKKLNINIAGEGGEYETLIIDAPFLENN